MKSQKRQIFFSELISNLSSTREFQELKQQNPGIFLSSVFILFDAANKGLYQVGYFDPQQNSVTTFILRVEDTAIASLEIAQASGIVESKYKIQEIDLGKVSYSPQEVLIIANDFKKNNYPHLAVIKSFCILQKLENQVFNFTFLSSSFQTLNIRISSDEGRIMESSLKSLISILK